MTLPGTDAGSLNSDKDVASPQSWEDTSCGFRTLELLRMTIDELKACTKKDPSERARRHGIPGWHGMSKEELVKALASHAQRAKRATVRTKKSKAPKPRKKVLATTVRARPHTAAARDT